MIFELVDDQETDIISALEQKCDTSSLVARFGEDPRVHKALNVLENTDYDLSTGLHNIYDQLCFYDDTWVRTFLLKQVGRNKEAEEYRRDFLKGYDPFKAFNPVVTGFAYCEQIEQAKSVKQLEVLVDCMDFDIQNGQDLHMKRMYPYLSRIAGKRMNRLEKEEAYQKKVLSEISRLVGEGDALVKDWQVQEGAEKYNKARYLAEYQLYRPDLADWIVGRMDEVADKYLLNENQISESELDELDVDMKRLGGKAA